MHIFIAGVMQGSSFDGEVHDQGYRERIIAALRRQLPDAHVTDPWSLEPESASYDGDRLREAFLNNTALAGEADLLIAYLPHASMGTAIELWTAYHGRAYVIAVTPMARNWVVQITADKVLPDLECLLDYIQSGRLGEELKMRLIRRSPVDDQEPAV